MIRSSAEYFQAVVDSLTEHIAIIDSIGVIVYVNSAWAQFGNANECAMSNNWLGVDYLAVCDASAKKGDESAKKAADGIRRVIKGEMDLFHFEYPCHSDKIKRWFLMTITPLHLQNSGRYVISHQNITERKLAEEEAKRISLFDDLTNVANRRYFNDFFDREWRRCVRIKQPLSLILVDIDHFKLFNDHYGHIVGDGCLKAVADALKSFTKRPGDFCARYGGEEFVIILSDTDIAGATDVANAMLKKVKNLAIPHAVSPTCPMVTASFGVAGILPGKDADQAALLEGADVCLYEAKKRGRNRVCADTGGLIISGICQEKKSSVTG